MTFDFVIYQVLRIGKSYLLGPRDTIRALMMNTSTSWQSIVNNNAPLLNMLWTDQNFPWKNPNDVSPTIFLDPGRGVFDISYTDLARTTTYEDFEICIVSQLNSNCI